MLEKTYVNIRPRSRIISLSRTIIYKCIVILEVTVSGYKLERLSYSILTSTLDYFGLVQPHQNMCALILFFRGRKLKAEESGRRLRSFNSGNGPNFISLAFGISASVKILSEYRSFRYSVSGLQESESGLFGIEFFPESYKNFHRERCGPEIVSSC